MQAMNLNTHLVFPSTFILSYIFICFWTDLVGIRLRYQRTKQSCKTTINLSTHINHSPYQLLKSPNQLGLAGFLGMLITVMLKPCLKLVFWAVSGCNNSWIHHSSFQGAFVFSRISVPSGKILKAKLFFFRVCHHLKRRIWPVTWPTSFGRHGIFLCCQPGSFFFQQPLGVGGLQATGTSNCKKWLNDAKIFNYLTFISSSSYDSYPEMSGNSILMIGSYTPSSL